MTYSDNDVDRLAVLLAEVAMGKAPQEWPMLTEQQRGVVRASARRFLGSMWLANRDAAVADRTRAGLRAAVTEAADEAIERGLGTAGVVMSIEAALRTREG